jgi:hypothetical protein
MDMSVQIFGLRLSRLSGESPLRGGRKNSMEAEAPDTPFR